MPSCCFQRLILLHNLPMWFLLIRGFNNHLDENSSQMYMSTQTFLLRSTPTYSTPDWESLLRYFAFQTLSQWSFLPIFPYLQRCHCHLLHCPWQKNESHSRPMLPSLVASGHMCYHVLHIWLVQTEMCCKCKPHTRLSSEKEDKIF